MAGKWLCAVERLSGVIRKPYQQITLIQPFTGFTGCAVNHVNIASAGIMLDELRRTASEVIQQDLIFYSYNAPNSILVGSPPQTSLESYSVPADT